MGTIKKIKERKRTYFFFFFFLLWNKNALSSSTGDLGETYTAFYSCLKGNCDKVGIGHFSRVTAMGQEGMALSSVRGCSGWIAGKIYSQKEVRHWHGLPKEVVESLSLAVFKERLDVILRDVV